jgi:hypothetical protein
MFRYETHRGQIFAARFPGRRRTRASPCQTGFEARSPIARARAASVQLTVTTSLHRRSVRIGHGPQRQTRVRGDGPFGTAPADRHEARRRVRAHREVGLACPQGQVPEGPPAAVRYNSSALSDPRNRNHPRIWRKNSLLRTTNSSAAARRHISSVSRTTH